MREEAMSDDSWHDVMEMYIYQDTYHSYDGTVPEELFYARGSNIQLNQVFIALRAEVIAIRRNRTGPWQWIERGTANTQVYMAKISRPSWVVQEPSMEALS